MRVEMESGPVRLAPRQTLRVHDGAGATVRCDAGTVWITEEDEWRDVILSAGASYRLRHGGLALIGAFGDAAVSVN